MVKVDIPWNYICFTKMYSLILSTDMTSPFTAQEENESIDIYIGYMCLIDTTLLYLMVKLRRLDNAVQDAHSHTRRPSFSTQQSLCGHAIDVQSSVPSLVVHDANKWVANTLQPPTTPILHYPVVVINNILLQSNVALIFTHWGTRNAIRIDHCLTMNNLMRELSTC